MSTPVADAAAVWPRLTLGTVQFGYPYGIARSSVARGDVERTLARAWALGIDTLDTAPVYGKSEAIIGEEMPAGVQFRFITKTIALRQPRISADDVDRVLVRAQLSSEHLRSRSLDAILVHEAEDLLVDGSDLLFAGLQRLRDEGLVRRVGVSVYDRETLDTILERHLIEIVQLPLNVFDQRFLENGYLLRLVDRGIEVHTRSVFLQGLLLQSPGKIPPRFARAEAALTRFHECMRALGLSPVEGALLFAASQKGVSRLVIGVEGIESLEADVRALAKAKSFADRVEFSKFAIDDPDITDPRNWT